MATSDPNPRGAPAATAAAVAAVAARAWRAAARFGSPRRLRATAAFLAGLARRIRERRAEPRLTVAVDVDSLYETLTGVGWYLHELIAHLAQRDDLRLRLYGHRLIAAPGAGSPGQTAAGGGPGRTAAAGGAGQTRAAGGGLTKAPAVPLPGGPAVEHVTYAAPDGLVVPPWRADQLLRRAAPFLVAADGNRVLFGPNYLLPPLFAFARGARVVTVHDLGFARLPWAVRPDTALALRERLERTLLEADLLLTPSMAVAGELVASGVAPSRVRPIHHGPGQHPPAAGPAALPRGTPAAYGLFVGTLEPRKNLATLIEAWRELRRGGGAPPLVVCGPPGWKARQLRRAMAAAEGEGWLVYQGYVAAGELAALYRGAAVVALPSLYEGFGLPVVEALAAGAPLVLSDIAVFHEVAGDAALYCPPRRADLWTQRLRQVLSDDGLRQDLAQRGRQRAARFDWRLAANATADAFRDAAGRP
jgi:glycosyltransferase involved in cell wall biosynthesis